MRMPAIGRRPGRRRAGSRRPWRTSSRAGRARGLGHERVGERREDRSSREGEDERERLVRAASEGDTTDDDRGSEHHRGHDPQADDVAAGPAGQRLAPPASPRHWREYRGAFELAHAWTAGDGAERLGELLGAAPALAGVRLERAIAERKTLFDNIPGGPRNHDLLVLARAQADRVVVGMEAKADESFDRDLTGFCAAARRRQPETRAPERLDRLTRAFLGTTLGDDPSLGLLRYQLFAALAGTLAEAALHAGGTARANRGRRRGRAARAARLPPAPAPAHGRGAVRDPRRRARDQSSTATAPAARAAAPGGRRTW
jgi:hypothetical protein